MLKDYEDRFCLFLDILGFKEIVDETAKNTSRKQRPSTSTVYFGLKEIADSLDYENYVVLDRKGNKAKSTRRVSQFSDSVVVSYSAKEVGGLSDILYDVLQVQLSLIHRKLLVRGAITRGKLYHRDDFVFGPALNEAAELEKLAMYPRVIIDKELLVRAKIIKSQLEEPGRGISRTPQSLIARDLDGLYFVDYFFLYAEDFNEEWSDLIEYLTALREVIVTLSRKRTASVKMKHSWMRQKFNDIARPLQHSQFRKYCGQAIPEDELDHIINIQPFD